MGWRVKGLLHINSKIPLTTSELPQLQLSDVIINGEPANNELTNHPTGISAPGIVISLFESCRKRERYFFGTESVQIPNRRG